MEVDHGAGPIAAGLGAAAFTHGNTIGLGDGVTEDLGDPTSMEVIGHEVAHALAGGGAGQSLLDRAGDAGEAQADTAGAAFRDFVTGGMQGPAPALGAALGGQAAIHRYKLPHHRELTRDAHSELVADTTLAHTSLLSGPDAANQLAAGAVWNDIPQGETGPLPTGIYEDPSNPANITARSHLGDLGFLHAMSGAPGEDPETTRQGMTDWTSFGVDVAMGNIDPSTPISELPPGIAGRFSAPEHQGMTVAQLFGAESPEEVRRMAAGSVLHMVQDTYTASHASRNEAGELDEFYNYGVQGPLSHLLGDTDQNEASGARSQEMTREILAAMARGGDIEDPEERRLAAERLKTFVGDEVFNMAGDARPSTGGIYAVAPAMGREPANRDIASTYRGGRRVLDTVGDAWETATDWMGDRADDVGEGWDAATDWVSNTASEVGDTVSSGWDSATDWVGDTASDIGDTVSSGWDSATDWVGDTASGIGDTVSSGWDSATDWAGDTASDVGEGLSAGWSSTTNWVGSLFD